MEDERTSPQEALVACRSVIGGVLVREVMLLGEPVVLGAGELQSDERSISGSDAVVTLPRLPRTSSTKSYVVQSLITLLSSRKLDESHDPESW